MAHVVVDQAKGKAPVHDGQAPLRRRIIVSAHDAGGYELQMAKVAQKKDQIRQNKIIIHRIDCPFKFILECDLFMKLFFPFNWLFQFECFVESIEGTIQRSQCLYNNGINNR